jgi:hypothetical protein
MSKPDYSKIKAEPNPVRDLRAALKDTVKVLCDEWKAVCNNGTPAEKAQVAKAMAAVYSALTR